MKKLRLRVILICSDYYNRILWTEWLKQQTLTVLETGMSKVKVQVDSVPAEPSSYLLAISSHGGERELCSFLFLRALTHYEGPTLRTSSKLNYLARALPPNTIRLGIKASTCECWKDTHMQCSFHNKRWRILPKVRVQIQIYLTLKHHLTSTGMRIIVHPWDAEVGGRQVEVEKTGRRNRNDLDKIRMMSIYQVLFTLFPDPHSDCCPKGSYKILPLEQRETWSFHQNSSLYSRETTCPWLSTPGPGSS